MRRVLLLGILAVTLVGTGLYGQGIVINEVAWAGTAGNASDEWIELYNPTDSPVDLSGWTLTFGDYAIDLGEAVNTIVQPGGYFLLERTDDDTVSDIPADLIYTGGLTNQGVVLNLLDATGAVVDMANAAQESGWAAGSIGKVEIPYATMERIDPTGPDVAGNWASNNGLITCGHDAAGEAINGTPRAKNSATIVRETTPTVMLNGPSKGQAVSGKLVIAWQAQDPDGDDAALQVDIYVSADGGDTFSTIVSGLVGSSYVWDTTGVENGDQYLLKVAVKDIDANVGEAMSPIFSIAN